MMRWRGTDIDDGGGREKDPEGALPLPGVHRHADLIGVDGAERDPPPVGVGEPTWLDDHAHLALGAEGADHSPSGFSSIPQAIE